MDVIISNSVRGKIDKYADALTRYPIPQTRAMQKIDNTVATLMALGNIASALPICMNKDLSQVLDREGNPKNENLKRFNCKDESKFQWAFACLIKIL